jgi:hypothetical protein
MKKKTTVEWLEEEITNRITRRNPHDSIIIQTQGETLIELFEQAKEMEKEQELKEWIEAWSLGYDSGFNNCMKKFNNKQQIT